MSIPSYSAGLQAVDNIIRSFGGSSSSDKETLLQQSLNRLAQQAAKLGSDKGSTTGSQVAVKGVNNSQVSQVAVNSAGNSANLSLSGSVIQAAKAASLTVVGGPGGAVTSAGRYQISGSGGNAILNLTQGESFNDVATQVNQNTKTTGVFATVQGNNLVLTSTNVGSNSTVNFQALNVASTSVSGLNSGQVSSFQVGSQAPGTSDVLTGTVTTSASAANLVYHGTTGATVAGTAAFQLIGSNGSTAISITEGESLTAVANRINQQTSSTGVIASVNGNDLNLTSSSSGVNAIVQVNAIQTTEQVSTTGVNNTQVSSVTVGSIASDTSDTLSGQVVQSATQAAVTLQGSSQGKVVDSATFKLTGALGSTDISVTQGQSLSDVATQVNALTSSTGVVATVVSNNLEFQSSGVGSAANVAVQLTDITHTTVVTGVSSQQLSSFQTNSITTGASDTLSGTVTQSATQASVTLQGTSQGNVVDSATFNLTGALGSTNISVTQGQSLSSVATQVNALTSSTGVVASVVSNNLVFQSSSVGSAANVAVQLTDITHTTVVSGVNSQQLSSFQANSFTSGASETINGTVSQTASQASVTLQGSSQGNVVDTATFQLTGALGSTSISITQGQSLSSVATQVNALTGSTGVVASVVSNNLVFKSSNVGSAANVAVQLTNISHTTVVSGVNSQQLTSFQANSFTAGASETLNGTVSQTAGVAQLSFAGSLGLVSKNTTFTLTGSQGSTQITTTSLESLSSLVSDVNAATATTGVKAVLSGSTVNFQSVNVGSNATVAITSTQGNFTTTGGNSSGSRINTANGTNAVATINGQTVTGNGNSFNFSDALGSYSFTTAAGFTGTLSTISVNSQAGQFNLSGGHGDGTANGADAIATINGHTLTGTGNSFQFSDALGSYSFTTAAGFTGTLSTISINSQAGQFNLSGGHGDGTANGTDAKATINGQTLTGTGNAFQFTDSVGSYSFNTVAGFTGTLNTINVNSQAGQFNLIGGNGDGTANGTDAVASINGQTLTGTGNTFQYTDEKGQFQIGFAAGFQGAFNPITIQSKTSVVELQGGGNQQEAHGTNLVANINGIQISSSTNQVTYAGTNGTYRIRFASGFTGQIDPISVTQSAPLKVTGGDQNGIAHGTDGVAIIDGNVQTGDGSNFTYKSNGADITLKFAAGFQGHFDSISINQNTTNAAATSPGSDSTGPAGASSTAHASGSINNSQTALLSQYAIKQKLVLYQFEQVQNIIQGFLA